MRSRERLCIVLRIPVAVEHNDSGSLDEVDALASGARGEEKQKSVRILSAILVDRFLTCFAGDATVKSHVRVTSCAAIILQDVQNARHLTEDESSMPTFAKMRKELVQELQLSRARYQRSGARAFRRDGSFDAVEQKRVLATLTDFHHDVRKVCKTLSRVATLPKKGKVTLK